MNEQFLDRSLWDLGEGVRIHPEARIEVTKRLSIGDRTVVNRGVVIRGACVEFGRECWLAEGSSIGGGGCFDWRSYLRAGDWLHMGMGSHINITRGVYIGDEVGLGRDTRVYTHGAYLPAWEGFPVHFMGVTIGSRVWLPAATVLPGMTIGSDVVVAAGTLVNRGLPNGCLAGGVPVRIIKERQYPRELTEVQKAECIGFIVSGLQFDVSYQDGVIRCGDTFFDLDHRIIEGPTTFDTLVLKDHLRRYGIRFPYRGRDGEFVPW